LVRRLEHPIAIDARSPASIIGLRTVGRLFGQQASGTPGRPAALPLDLGDGALAVLLAPGLNASS